MIRVGTHYVEPRRIGYFIVEAGLLFCAFVLVSAAVASVSGRALVSGPDLSGWLARGVFVALALQLGFYLADLHDLKTAMGRPSMRIRRIPGGRI